MFFVYIATDPAPSRTPQQKRKALSPVVENRSSSASSPFVRRKIDGVQIHIAGINNFSIFESGLILIGSVLISIMINKKFKRIG